MKRMMLAVIALLCVCSIALAMEVPSRTIQDLPNASLSPKLEVEFADDEQAAAGGLFLELLTDFSEMTDDPQYKELLEIHNSELGKLQQAVQEGSASNYFGNVIRVHGDRIGDVVSILDLFSGIEPDVFEFSPVVAGGYAMEYGQIKATLMFATPYNEGEDVVVLVGAIDHDPKAVEMMRDAGFKPVMQTRASGRVVAQWGGYGRLIAEGGMITDELPEFDALDGGDVVITWYAHRGTAVKIPEVEEADGIEVTFPVEMMTILQDRDTLIAVASLPAGFSWDDEEIEQLENVFEEADNAEALEELLEDLMNELRDEE